MSEKARELEKVLGYSFRDRELMILALTHPSYAFENAMPSNQRLEFLGDAVLSLVVADDLFHAFPGAAEGELTQRRSDIVQGKTLSEIARGLGLGGFILLGHGEEKQRGRRVSSNLANVLEALVGAIYLDGGIRPARAFIRRYFIQDTRGRQRRGGRVPLRPSLISRLHGLFRGE